MKAAIVLWGKFKVCLEALGFTLTWSLSSLSCYLLFRFTYQNSFILTSSPPISPCLPLFPLPISLLSPPFLLYLPLSLCLSPFLLYIPFPLSPPSLCLPLPSVFPLFIPFSLLFPPPFYPSTYSHFHLLRWNFLIKTWKKP